MEGDRSSWYLSSKEIENNSPSRKDGIDARKEAQLRGLYCSFILDVGIRLRIPQITIATATMFCHRFYLHQSHAKNEWQTVATACIFLASKVEDTPCSLENVVIVAYETMYRREPAAAQRIYQKDVKERQKALIVLGERVLLSTIRFDFNIQHPYKPLLEAIKKLGITQKDVKQTAWNFVNDWLRTTLCLQYKPHYIAAGSLCLAAKARNVKLPAARGNVWWQEFDVTPSQLNAVLQQMMQLTGLNKRQTKTHAPEKPKAIETPPEVKEEASSSPDCVLNGPDSSRSSSTHEDGELGRTKSIDSVDHDSSSRNADATPECEVRDPECPNGVVEDGDGFNKCLDKVMPVPGNKLDVDRIKALIKRRKREREIKREAMDDSNEEVWIERELEAGIQRSAEPVKKQQRLEEATKVGRSFVAR